MHIIRTSSQSTTSLSLSLALSLALSLSLSFFIFLHKVSLTLHRTSKQKSIIVEISQILCLVHAFTYTTNKNTFQPSSNLTIPSQAGDGAYPLGCGKVVDLFTTSTTCHYLHAPRLASVFNNVKWNEPFLMCILIFLLYLPLLPFSIDFHRTKNRITFSPHFSLLLLFLLISHTPFIVLSFVIFLFLSHFLELSYKHKLALSLSLFMTTT